jgi:hypothetical protein
MDPGLRRGDDGDAATTTVVPCAVRRGAAHRRHGTSMLFHSEQDKRGVPALRFASAGTTVKGVAFSSPLPIGERDRACPGLDPGVRG